jgi:hypothetical protein
MILDITVAFDTIVALAIPLVPLLTSWSVMWRKEYLWNCSVLQRVHLPNAVKISVTIFNRPVTCCRSKWPCGLRRGSWPVGCWDRGVESRSRHGCLSLVCVVLSCVGRGLATGWSLVQGVLPYVEIAQEISYMWSGQCSSRTIEPRGGGEGEKVTWYEIRKYICLYLIKIKSWIIL